VGDIYDPTEMAANKGLKWLRCLLDRNFQRSDKLQYMALFYRDLEMLKYLKEKGVELDIESLRSGDIYVVKPQKENKEKDEEEEIDNVRECTKARLSDIHKWLDEQ